ncbi:CBS domain-containing protein [Eudoraea sp.]|uniref:CBS domain-containing protein n=1 Tax=Eudoraea sp. TaxID=1979955 RepID=UPI003C74E6DE
MGIKSFQGPRMSQPSGDEIPFKVSDFMTKKLITFKPEQSMQDAIETLISNRISGGPVVNEENELIGVISEGDCISHISKSRYYNMPLDDAKVEDSMIKDVETIDGDMNIFDAANKFLEAKRRRFPIVENGKLVGQISQKDILIATMNLKTENWK